MAPDSVLDKVKRFVETVRKHGISVQEAYLFGSWTQGRASEWSDIDLAIVSSHFAGNRFDDRRKLVEALLEVDTDIQVHPYRPQDFNESNPFVREILRTGVRIA